jgi:CheY-like chemotaxis protein
MRRILVVDDEPHICLAIRAWLKRYGFRVTIADGGSNVFPRWTIQGST